MKIRPLNVLMVYDHAETRDWIFRLLRQSGIGPFQLHCFQPYELNPGAAALTIPDVCLIDSSIEQPILFARVRAIKIHAPIIVLTTDSGSDVLDALHHGAADCLIKDRLTSAILEESICAIIDKACATESRAQRERLYLSLVENSNDLIYTHDLNGDCTSINKAGEEILGYSCEETLKMNFQALIAPEYRELCRGCIKRLLESRKPSYQELVMISRERHRLSFSINSHLIYQDGSPIGVQGIGRLIGGKLPMMGRSPSRVTQQLTKQR